MLLLDRLNRQLDAAKSTTRRGQVQTAARKAWKLLLQRALDVCFGVELWGHEQILLPSSQILSATQDRRQTASQDRDFLVWRTPASGRASTIGGRARVSSLSTPTSAADKNQTFIDYDFRSTTCTRIKSRVKLQEPTRINYDFRTATSVGVCRGSPFPPCV